MKSALLISIYDKLVLMSYLDFHFDILLKQLCQAGFRPERVLSRPGIRLIRCFRIDAN
jgi:hypothetical protein